MKKIITITILILSFLSANSQTYPIKTKLKGDSVVILTLEQFESLDLLLKNGSEKNKNTKRELDTLKKNFYSLKLENKKNLLKIDSISRVNIGNIATIDSLKKINIETDNWFTERAIDNALIYYDWKEKKIKCLDFSMYGFYVNRYSGSITIFRRWGSIKNRSQKYWKEWNREYPEPPIPNWNNYIRDSRKLFIIEYPKTIKVPYEPKQIICPASPNGVRL